MLSALRSYRQQTSRPRLPKSARRRRLLRRRRHVQQQARTAWPLEGRQTRTTQRCNALSSLPKSHRLSERCTLFQFLFPRMGFLRSAYAANVIGCNIPSIFCPFKATLASFLFAESASHSHVQQQAQQRPFPLTCLRGPQLGTWICIRGWTPSRRMVRPF